MQTETNGFCKYCGKEYTKTGILIHLPSCEDRKAALEKRADKYRCGCFRLAIEGKYEPDYWLIIEICETATLKDLDQFIRDIWVECCGHLSAFEAGGVRYEVHPNSDTRWGAPAKSMNQKLKEVAVVGQTMEYEYDFGLSTDLRIKVQSYDKEGHSDKKITLISRNNPLNFKCSHCVKNMAQWVNPVERYGRRAFWCEECIRDEEGWNDPEIDPEDLMEFEVPETFLPVCNSPRMGVCAYEGSSIYPDQFSPDTVKKRFSKR